MLSTKVNSGSFLLHSSRCSATVSRDQPTATLRPHGRVSAQGCSGHLPSIQGQTPQLSTPHLPPSCLWHILLPLRHVTREKALEVSDSRGRAGKRLCAERKLRPLVKHHWVSRSCAPATRTTRKGNDCWDNYSSLATSPPPSLSPHLQSGGSPSDLLWQEHSGS